MVKKKSVKRVSKKKSVKTIKRVDKPKKLVISNKKKISKHTNAVRSNKKKIILILKNLILFTVISLVSFILYLVSNKEIFKNLFSILAMVFAFVSVAFLITLLIFVFLKLLKI